MKKLFKNVDKEKLLILVVIMLILLFIGYQCYSVTHIELKTQTATVSTIYDKIESEVLFIRDEQVVKNNGSGVTVPCLQDGDKINVSGDIAMVFPSSKVATKFSRYSELARQVEYYENLEAQTVGQSANLETINEDIEQKVLDYAYGTSKNQIGDSAKNLDSVLVRRQLIIGEDVDLISIIQKLRQEMESYSSAKPDKYIKAKTSGVFTSYTDGYENIIDFDKAEETTAEEFEKAIKSVTETNNSSDNLGKLVTSYTWYIQTLVDTDAVQDMENGDYVTIALADDNSVEYKAKIITGAEPELGKKKTLLILKLNEMDAKLASIRKANIEIRRKSYKGFRVPTDALHIAEVEVEDEENKDSTHFEKKKGVYVLIASQVRFRTIKVIYSGEDYVLVEYDPADSKSIHLYDKIITQGKDLEDGRVYT